MLDSFLPWVLLLMNLTMGGDILGDLVGIATGHLYYFVKDIVPIKYEYDILKTPEFLIRLIDKPKPQFVPVEANNSNNNNNIRNREPQFIPLNQTGDVSASYRENDNAAPETRNQHQGNRFESMRSEEANWD